MYIVVRCALLRGDRGFKPHRKGIPLPEQAFTWAGCSGGASEMKRLTFILVALAITGCAAGPTETPFMSAIDRAYGVGCDIKTLEWTEQRSRLECHE